MPGTRRRSDAVHLTLLRRVRHDPATPNERQALRANAPTRPWISGTVFYEFPVTHRFPSGDPGFCAAPGPAMYLASSRRFVSAKFERPAHRRAGRSSGLRAAQRCHLGRPKSAVFVEICGRNPRFTYANLLWTRPGTDADQTKSLEQARASLYHAIDDAPHQAGAWLLLAGLASTIIGLISMPRKF